MVKEIKKKPLKAASKKIKKSSPGRGSLERSMLEDFLEKSFTEASERTNITVPSAGTVSTSQIPIAEKDRFLRPPDSPNSVGIKDNILEIKDNNIENNESIPENGNNIENRDSTLEISDNNIENRDSTLETDNNIASGVSIPESRDNTLETRDNNIDSAFNNQETTVSTIETGIHPETDGTTHRTPAAGITTAPETPNNIENYVDNIENLCYETPNNIDINVIPSSEGEKQLPNDPPLTEKIYDNNIDIKVNGAKITKEIYDNNIDTYVISNHPETDMSDNKTIVHGAERLYLDGMKLYTAMSSIKLSRSEKTIIEGLYRYGEKVNSLNLEILLYQFVQSIGISSFTICNSNKKLSECGLFEHFVSTRRMGTFIRLKGSFFYTADRKIDRYKIFLSIRDKHPVFISCILELLLDSANVNKVLQKNILSFTEIIRKNLSVSPQKEMTECGALLTAVLKNLLVPGISIRNISSYLNAVLKKEGLSLVERLTNSEIENGRKFSRLLERIFKGELDELSAEDLSFLLGETVLRSDGAEKIYNRLCSVLENQK